MIPNTLRNDIKRGIIATASARYSDYVLQLVVSAVLARILTPEQFGTVAVVTVLLAFFKLVGDAGLGPAVIQRRDLTIDDESALFSLSLTLALILGLLFAASTPLVASFYAEDEYFELVPVMAIALTLNIGSVVPQALLRKRRQFGLLGLVVVCSHILGGSVGIVLAVRGWGAMSLVVKAVVSSVAIFVSALFLSRVRLRPSFQLSLYRSIASYAGFQFLFQFINYFSRNLDKLLIGRYLGQASLGYYEKSYRLMMLPLQTLTHVITPVLHPVMSTVQDDKERIARGFLTITRLLALIGFPLSVFLYFTAREIVLIIFGGQWEQSVPVFTILSWSVGLQMVLSSTGSIFQVSGRTDLLFLSGSISALFMVGCIVIGLIIGSTEAVAFALVAAFMVNFFQGTGILVVSVLRGRYRDFIVTLVAPTISAAGVFGALWIVTETLDFSAYSLWMSFLIKTIIGTVSFIAMLIATRQLSYIRTLLGRRR